VGLPTVHELPHILGESIYDPKGLSCGHPSLVLRESVQPLQDRLDVLLSEKLLYQFNYVVLIQVTYRPEPKWTHSIVVA